MPEFTEIVPEALANVIELQAELISTVTVIPLLMVTAVADVGTGLPPHVAVLLQSPLTLAMPGASVNVVTALRIPSLPMAK